MFSVRGGEKGVGVGGGRGQTTWTGEQSGAERKWGNKSNCLPLRKHWFRHGGASGVRSRDLFAGPLEGGPSNSRKVGGGEGEEGHALRTSTAGGSRLRLEPPAWRSSESSLTM